MAALEGSAREPLAAEAGELPASKCSRCRLAGAVGAVLGLAAVAGVCYYFFVQRSLQCHIDFCSDVTVPDGAGSCQEARCASCAEGRSPASDETGGFCGLACGLAHCAQRVIAARGATSCQAATARLRCSRCEDGWDLELDRKSLEPTGNCSFSCTATQRQAGCAPDSCREDGSCASCRPGFSSAASSLRGAASCAKAPSAVPMSFYMYRAQSKTNYPPENCDLASAAGVVWYLHNEVVKMCPRHYNISRVLRYNVTIFNPQAVYPVRQGQFGHFVQFDYGQCTVPDCKANWWDKYGYMVGCQQQDEQMWKYAESYWYSLPGRCPSQKWSNKSQECVDQEPGGNCSSPDGSASCTWHAEPAGEVTVNELSGISDIDAFCAAGNLEYDERTDKGRGCSFWDDKFNATRNKDRVLALRRLFAKHAPTADAFAMPPPLCDGF